MKLAKLDVFVSIETLRSYVDRLGFKSYRAAHKHRLIAKHRKNQETYINILANRFHPWFTNITAHQERDFIFQESGASCHTGGYIRWWKETHQIKGFEYWPAQRPDLNSIEHIRNAIER
ncbi:hypothetical protein RO3G_01013 [Rhizopus delemar RA 99-880]|uniref:Tc1-like transposase DDE domain-containing protein n=1 Tax=Rhizopus delemar (strain RA 99-880 / ATCC MYA-4621 / FGSC 9543 / NRRL 43880) TaxID=246409 RepID=I1BJC9_RHIO9|nr:hypothetical protein RO3G_01013 [Rhizopus delemar RA 99-880]|eukprot:EIE76309.1 hypothetical protein RO3G_01013 [Rhizopus delemar RA 99-880]